jgi:hypothetical protein
MKKLILALAVAGAAGLAMAQSGSAECAGAASNPNAFPDSCFGGPQGRPYQGYQIFRGQAYNNNPWGLIAQGVPYRGGYSVPYASLYPRTRNDRDGDGVRNRRDRYPDDPRYR